MSSMDKYAMRAETADAVPFSTVVEAWFWFIHAQAARNDGARYALGVGMISRPCEPVDILKILNRLHRQRRLLMDHFLVLRHYGLRLMPPDPSRVKEMRAHKLWTEAMACLEDIFIRKGIVQAPPGFMEEAAE